MQHLEVPRLIKPVEGIAPAMLSTHMDSWPKQAIKEVSWPAYPYRPHVEFTIAHAGQQILLKYDVTEQQVRAVNDQINSPVYEDSCVEFFIAFDESGYYNLQFNSIGTALVGYGSNSNERV